MRKIFILTVITVCLYASLPASNYSQASYLLINSYPRVEAIGPGSGSVLYGAGSLSENPASAAGIENFEFSAMQNMWFQGVTSQKLSVVKYFDFGNLGAEVSHFDMGSIQKFDVDEFGRPVATTDILNLYSVAGKVIYGRKIRNFSVGAAVQIIYEDFGKEEFYLGFDAGVMYEDFIAEQLDFGLSILNISKEENDFSLPLSAKGGFAYGVELNGEEVINLILGAEYLKNDNSLNAGFGFDYVMLNPVSFRGGINVNEKGETGFSAGVGLKFEGIRVNYSYTPNGVLGDVHKISLEGSIPKSRLKDEDIVSKGGESYEEYIKSGDFYYKAKKYQKALKYYEYINMFYWREVEKLSDSDKAILFQKIGISYYNIRDNNHAKEFFDRALFYDKDNEILKHWIRLIK